jgi:hypothetical protein
LASAIVLALALALSPQGVAAQVTVVDEGTFSILIAGARAGREDFSIRRTTEGSFVAQGNVLRGDVRATVVLSTDSVGNPDRFRFDSNRGGRGEEHVTGERRGALWSGLAVTSAGETGREFRLPPASQVADDGALHHLWFLMRFIGEGGTPLLDPRAMSLRQVVVEAAGADSVTIGLDKLEARKWIVRGVNGAAMLSEVWTDTQGRLLRVRIQAEDLDATRDEPPPETPVSPPAYDLSNLPSI